MMRTSIALLLLYIIPSAAYPSCSICGDGKIVTLREADLIGQVTCGMMQDAGKYGFLTEEVCEDAQEISGATCGCTEELLDAAAGTPSPTLMPTAPPTTAPTAWTNLMTNMPTIIEATSDCSICGPGMEMTNPIGNVIFEEGEQGTTCAALDVFATGGMLDDICDVLPTYTTDCGCVASGNPVTVSPTLTPTLSPTSIPTAAPTAEIQEAVSATVADLLDEDSCQICPTGSTMLHPSGMVLIDGTPFRCSILAIAAANGFLPGDSCDEIPTLAHDACGCSSALTIKTGAPTTAPTSAPTTAAPSPAPTTETIIEDAGAADSCAICTNGATITNPSAIVKIDSTSFSCLTLQRAADFGFLLPSLCADLPSLAGDICGCEAEQMIVEDPTTQAPPAITVGTTSTTKPPFTSLEKPPKKGGYLDALLDSLKLGNRRRTQKTLLRGQ